jgi:predicted nucleic acid-binding protein
VIILDTNVVSELMRPSPSRAVAAWVLRQQAPLVITALTLAEIRFGIARLPEGGRRATLLAAADEQFVRFRGQVLAFDAAAAEHYAELAARRERAGMPISQADAQTAAVCRARNAPLATRNTKDFVGVGIDTIDPWQPD